MSFYEKTWFMWLMLLLFFPVGAVLMWKYSSYSTKVKGIITAVGVLCMIQWVVAVSSL